MEQHENPILPDVHNPHTPLDHPELTPKVGRTILTGDPLFSARRRLKLKNTAAVGNEGWPELKLAKRVCGLFVVVWFQGIGGR